MLSEDINQSNYVITAYDKASVSVNNVRYSNSLIITPNQIIENWSPRNSDAITKADLSHFIGLSPEIILLGTGPSSVILPDEVLAPLYEKQYHVECMSTEAACRTYAILSAEGRRVAAGLIIKK